MYSGQLAIFQFQHMYVFYSDIPVTSVSSLIFAVHIASILFSTYYILSKKEKK